MSSSERIQKKKILDSHHIDARKVMAQTLASAGQPLDAETCAYMESHFAHDFSAVRVHTDTDAALSARSVGAKAYTLGNNIVFAKENYQPATTEGKKLIAHELTHVIQQSNSPNVFLPNPVVSTSTDGAEIEAASAASQVVEGGTPHLTNNTGVQVSRSEEEEYCQPPNDFSSNISLPEELIVERESPSWSIDNSGAGGASGFSQSIAQNGTEGAAGYEGEDMSRLSERNFVGDVLLGAGGAISDMVSGVGHMVHGAWNLTGGWLVNPEESRQTWDNTARTVEAITEHPELIWEGLKKPYVDAWESGHPGEAIGRGIVDIGSLFLGGAGAAAKGARGVAIAGEVGEAARVAGAVGEIGEAARVASAMGEIGESARAARVAGEVGEAARTAGVAGEIGDVGRTGEAVGEVSRVASNLEETGAGISRVDRAEVMASEMTSSDKIVSEVSEVGNDAHNAADFDRLKANLAAQEIEGAPATGSALKPDTQHRAASYVTDTASEGQHHTIRGGDGRHKNLTQVEGHLNGEEGIYEYIVDEKGNLTHQRFIPEGIRTGTPNQTPNRMISQYLEDSSSRNPYYREDL